MRIIGLLIALNLAALCAAAGIDGRCISPPRPCPGAGGSGPVVALPCRDAGGAGPLSPRAGRGPG